MVVRAVLSRRQNAKELTLSNCGAGEDCWKSLGQQGDQPVNLKGDQPWIFTGGLMLNLKLQYFGHLMRTDYSLEKCLMLGKIEGRRIRACQTMRCWTASPMQCIWTWANSVRWWGTGRREANTMRSHALNEEQPQLATTREILHTSLKNQCNQNK